MIRHIVLFKFLETAQGRSKAENLAEARERMLAMRGVIPQIRRMEVYLAAPGSKAGNYDYALVSEFDTLEDLAAYQAHPMHVAFGQFVGALREPEGRACIDYEVEG